MNPEADGAAGPVPPRCHYNRTTCHLRTAQGWLWWDAMITPYIMRRFLKLPLLLIAAVSALAAANPPVLPLGAPLPDYPHKGVDGKTNTPTVFSSAKIL